MRKSPCSSDPKKADSTSTPSLRSVASTSSDLVRSSVAHSWTRLREPGFNRTLTHTVSIHSNLTGYRAMSECQHACVRQCSGMSPDLGPGADDCDSSRVRTAGRAILRCRDERADEDH